jgi:hypothetical protein
VFSKIALAVCLFLMSSAAFGQQQQHRPRRSGGLDNLSLPSTEVTIASSSWQTVAPDGVGFSVMMPGLPDEMSKQMGPNNSTNLREYRVKADGTDYVVGVILNFPRELLQQPNFTQQYFDLLPTGMIRSADYASRNYKLISQRAVTINDYPGRQYKFDSEDYTCTMRAYITESSIYVVSVESRKATLSTEKVEKFLSSFTLKED